MLWGSTNSWKAFSASCWLWKHFPAKNWLRCLKKCQSAGERSADYGDETQLCSSIHSTSEALVGQCAAGCCHRERGPFCWPKLTAGAAVSSESDQCAEPTSQMQWFHRIQRAVVDQTPSIPSNREHYLFTVQVWLWEVRWSLLIPFSSHVTIHSRRSSLLLHRIREDDTSKRCFGPNVLMLRIVSCALQPILHSNKKITETCLSNSISMF